MLLMTMLAALIAQRALAQPALPELRYEPPKDFYVRQ